MESYYVTVCRVGLGMAWGGEIMCLFFKLPGNSGIIQVGNPGIDSNLQENLPRWAGGVGGQCGNPSSPATE